VVEPRTSRGAPDVLLIVLDCARADAFDAQLAVPGAMPFLSAMRPEVLAFSGAVSPSSWTIPGHASLFTGLYPWDHGAHYRNGPILTPEPETIAECLSRAGYGTAFFSGNAYVQPSTGLTRGFEQSSWGGGREFYLRFLGIDRPSCPNLGGPALVWLPPVHGEAPPSPLREFAMNAFTRLPAIWDGLNRVGGRVLGTYAKEMPEICSWLGPQLASWLATQPRERPVFAFVNLFEAHEPYLADAGRPVNAARWLAFARSGQEPARWVNGRWRPNARELSSLRSSYDASFRTIDRRIREIVEVFSRLRDWSQTLFVLTSDHGQAFLELETLYHRLRVDEPITRIPLWVRPPGGIPPGARADGWVSLIDVPRTIAGLAGRPSFGDPTARSLLDPTEDLPGRTVYSMTDGIPTGEVRGASRDRHAFLDRLEVAAYRGDQKAVASETGTLKMYRVERPLRTVRPEELGATPEIAPLAGAAREALELASARIASKPYHGSVEHRIAGWGY
jgi:arylsulfatase A-like enzyme